MLNSHRNRKKAELIRIFCDLASSLKAAKQSPTATEKHEHNTNRHFGKRNLELLPESWKLNRKIFIELFLGDLDEKMTSAGYKRKRNNNKK